MVQNIVQYMVQYTEQYMVQYTVHHMVQLTNSHSHHQVDMVQYIIQYMVQYTMRHMVQLTNPHSHHQVDMVQKQLQSTTAAAKPKKKLGWRRVDKPTLASSRLDPEQLEQELRTLNKELERLNVSSTPHVYV